MFKRYLVLVFTFALLMPAASASASGLENKPGRNCPSTFDRLLIPDAALRVKGILVAVPLEELVAGFEVVDQNDDNRICLRIGRPDFNPHFGAPHIVFIDNTRR